MKVIDLAHEVEPNMPLYPGQPAPRFKPLFQIEKDGYNLTEITMIGHHGTHVDAPLHMVKGGAPMNQVALERLVGPALVVDCTRVEGRKITAKHLEAEAADLKPGMVLLIRTGMSAFWGTDKYINEFPYPDASACEWIVKHAPGCVGFDTLSPDPVDSPDFGAHRTILPAGIPIIENLTNLDKLPRTGATFVAAPLKMAVDGSSVRAVAII